MTVETLSPPPRTADEASRLPATPIPELDAAVAALGRRKEDWLRVSPAERARLLDQLIRSFATVSDRWVEASLEAKGIPPANPAAGEEWLAGPYLIFRNLRLLKESLEAVAGGRRPEIPGPVTTRPGGQVSAQVFPHGFYDGLFFPGVTAEVWMEPGVTARELPQTQAVAYFDGAGPGRLALVLGAGNVSSIGPLDALYKLFVENQVVLFKAHPVNDYLGPLLEEGFAPLVERGFLTVVYGGAAEGEHLTQHPDIDEIHVTGSDKTVEAIVFGAGEEGRKRKAERRPRVAKRLTSELGNVSPVIVVPGHWSAGEITYQAENLVSMLVNNAGFNCTATRMVITHAGWPQREQLLAAMGRLLQTTPTRRAYYPGADKRFADFLAAHPEAKRFGDERFGRLPWMLIPAVDPERESDITFTTEAFASVFAETPIQADSPARFLKRAVAFANQELWGTLSAAIIVHPASRKDPELREALERALEELRYGTVSINHWPSVGYGIAVTPWGAFPGSDLYDVQSGQGVVHNTLMFSRPQKSVIRSPFRAWPKPPWFVSHATAHELGRALTRFEAEPSALKLPGILRLALTG